jgi:hypothetical protein
MGSVQTSHIWQQPGRDIAEYGMVDPVPTGIFGEGKVLNALLIDLAIQCEEDTGKLEQGDRVIPMLARCSDVKYSWTTDPVILSLSLSH